MTVDTPRRLDLSKVRPENRPALLELAALNAEQERWRKSFVAEIAGLTEAFMRRDGMWGVKLKGKTVLVEYDNTTEAANERRQRT